MLDNLAQIQKLDKGNILNSIERLPEQVEEAWEQTSNLLEIPPDYKNCQNIVIAGMGGSALGGRIIHYLEFNKLRAPLEVVTGYNLPSYVNSNSLVLLSSYSGNTEETITATHNALKRNAKIIGITTGGKLLDILERENLPVYKINPLNNPSGQPRMGLGYSISAISGILSKLQFIEKSDMQSSINKMEEFIKEFGVREPSKTNIAKVFAEKISRKIPILISSEHLIGSTHAMKNQINENSKSFSMHFEISELNHHLLEGLKFPMKAKEILHFLFFESKNYFERIQKRYPITQDVIKQNRYSFDIYRLKSQDKLEEVFEILILGSYISFYMAILHGIDPSPIPWVDYFKQKMDN